MTHKLQQIIDNVLKRDAQQVDEIYNGWKNPSIEEKLHLANARAVDALAALRIIVDYIIEKENNAN